MYDLAYIEFQRENVEQWINLTEKKRYKNIQINEENGLIYLEAFDLLSGQDYELHCLNPLYDIETIINILVENRLEMLSRGQS